MKNILDNLKAFILSHTSKTHEKLGFLLIEKGLTISSAESCTGGLLSSRLTDISGSSTYIKENFITYSDDSKHNILKVSSQTIKDYGTVSSKCAYEMASGLKHLTQSDIAICTTGVAGPLGDEGKAPGLMYMACSYRDKISVRTVNLNRHINRKNMKFLFTEEALKFVLETIKHY